MATDAILKVTNLHAGYGQSEVLHGLNFNVAPAEIVVVVGRNGMGKSTLMKSLIGMVPVKSGQIQLNGADVTQFKSHRRVAKGIAIVPQGRMIFSNMTVRENIETGLFVHNTPAVPPDIYTMFPVLQEMRDRRGGNLSGGQQQMLAIARALTTGPKVLLLDEPTEGIQPSIILELARTLKRIRDERGLSIVCSEQVLSFALDIADRVLVLEGGNIVHEDARADLDQEKVARYLAV
ncbi:MAG TPA: urea ABC transporter ATP-binding subunit UrtE [Rhodopila sp.]|nr:urea ABC transporter ATP-binding subunit UrtE [Rhodopila sp.]